jgi:hypothetical protein
MRSANFFTSAGIFHSVAQCAWRIARSVRIVLASVHQEIKQSPPAMGGELEFPDGH